MGSQCSSGPCASAAGGRSPSAAPSRSRAGVCPASLPRAACLGGTRGDRVARFQHLPGLMVRNGQALGLSSARDVARGRFSFVLVFQQRGCDRPFGVIFFVSILLQVCRLLGPRFSSGLTLFLPMSFWCFSVPSVPGSRGLCCPSPPGLLHAALRTRLLPPFLLCCLVCSQSHPVQGIFSQIMCFSSLKMLFGSLFLFGLIFWFCFWGGADN